MIRRPFFRPRNDKTVHHFLDGFSDELTKTAETDLMYPVLGAAVLGALGRYGGGRAGKALARRHSAGHAERLRQWNKMSKKYKGPGIYPGRPTEIPEAFFVRDGRTLGTLAGAAAGLGGYRLTGSGRELKKMMEKEKKERRAKKR